MVSVYSEKQKKENVVTSPKDEILKGVIISIEKGLLEEFLDESVREKFDNLDQPTLKIYFEYEFNNIKIKGSDRIPYYEKPMENSNLGKFLNKYEKLETEVIIKIIFDSKGFGKIKLD